MSRKALILMLIAVLVATAAYAAVFPNHFGASVALGGRSDSMLQTSLALTVTPIHLEVLTPYLFTEAYVQLSDTALGFGGFRAGMGLELMCIRDHAFSFMTANPTVWAPAVIGGIDYEKGILRGFAQISVFRFMEKDAIYEYLTPFADFDQAGLERLGILMFRFSGLF